MEEIENLLTKGQIISQSTKGISNALTAEKRAILNLNVKLNQRVKIRIEQIIRTFDF